MILVPPTGPIPAKIMIVGEAPGEEEERRLEPFVGMSGLELNRMLAEAKIGRNECFITNVCRVRPPKNDINAFIAKAKKDVTPQHTQLLGRWVLKPIFDGFELLCKEISLVKPNIIIACGNTPLWALAGVSGITKWRGSMLFASNVEPQTKVIPIYHPAAVLREWSWRAITVSDLKRAARFRNGEAYPKPEWNFIVRPGFERAINCLQELLERLNQGPTRLSFDLETRNGHIACAGISWTLRDALCIPFMCVGEPRGYWSADEEYDLICLLKKVLTHSNAQIVGQNILYDSQYTWRHWNFVPNVRQDCMITQHSLFSDLPKNLAFQASMYADYYVYWKDEGKDWDKALGEESLWYYNCEDCVYTDEVGQVELKWAAEMGLLHVNDQQQRMLWPVLQAMIRGVRIDLKRRDELIDEVETEIDRREKFLLDIIGYPLNPKSPKQMMAFFYEELNQTVIMTRAKKGVPARPTLNDEALQTISKREPILRPIVNAIADIRTLGIFLSNFLTCDLDSDSRMRCAYNIGGSASGKSAPKTYRLSSSENAFGTGTNLQNIPSAKSKSVGKAAARGAISGLGDPYHYPNVRSIFIPDEGYTFFDGDLDRADLQVVAWETDDEMLKAALRLGADIHLMNVFILDGKDPPPLEELVEGHPKYLDYRIPRSAKREFSKTFCHGTNYGGKPRTMSAHTGRTYAEVERAQRIWFGAHPGLTKWHDRVKDAVIKRRFVENRFGYRWHIFDRPESIIPEAIAWIPQSTVSIIINKIWLNIYETLPEVHVLLQTHDSLAGQFPTVTDYKKRIEEAGRIVVPYEDPLTIPFSVKTSALNWGACI